MNYAVINIMSAAALRCRADGAIKPKKLGCQKSICPTGGGTSGTESSVALCKNTEVDPWPGREAPVRDTGHGNFNMKHFCELTSMNVIRAG